MKVLLAYRCPEDVVDVPEFRTLPAGLRWLAASLARAGHPAVVANFSRLGWKDAERYVAAAQPDVVGVSCLTSNRATSARLLRVARRAAPEAVTCLGGPHASAIPDLILRRVRELDMIVVGEGEGAMVRACDALAARGRVALASVPGVAVRGVAAASPVSLPHVDDLPRPVVGVEGAGLDPDRDFRHVVASRRRAGGPALRSPRSVATEMAEMRDELGVVEASLVGPSLIVEPAWLAELASELLRARTASSWELATDAAELAGAASHPGLGLALQRAHQAGCRRLRVVIDAGVAGADLAPGLAEASGHLRAAGVAVHAVLRHGVVGSASPSIAMLRTLVRALQPREGSLEAREVLPGSDDWRDLAARDGLDDRFWFDESRTAIPVGPDAATEVAESALAATLREVGRSARASSRDLEALAASGDVPTWTHVDWADWRASLGDLPEAERRLRLAAREEPWNPFPWLRLAALAARERPSRGPGGSAVGQPSAADREAAALREVLARVPKHAPTLARLDELAAERDARPQAARKPGRDRAVPGGRGAGGARTRRGGQRRAGAGGPRQGRT